MPGITNYNFAVMNKIKVAVFEDHHPFRNTLHLLLSGAEDMEVTGMFGDVMRIDDSVFANPPDVMLMDIDMPGRSGTDAIIEIKQRLPQVEIIMFTVFDQDDKIFTAIKNGASGYLLKKSASAEILDSIRQVSKGGSPMTPSVARRVLDYFKSAPKESSYNLTDRETEIVRSLVDGDSYKMIATRYSISPNTVRNHLRNIYEKLQVHSKSEVVARALKEGWMK
jgi:DNA-binding NarL/FixJ family response regulator